MNEIEIYTQNCDKKNVVDCFYFECRFRDVCKRHQQLKSTQTKTTSNFHALWRDLRLWLQHERDMANDNRYYSHASAFGSVLDRMFILENSQKQETNKVG